MDNDIFTTGLKIHRQIVRGIHYSSNLGEIINYNRLINEDFICKYEVLTHKDNVRDFIVIIEFAISSSSKTSDKEGLGHHFQIIVDGHYEVEENVDAKHINDAKHVGALSCLISFLRTSIFNLTALTVGEPFQLPPLNMQKLHKEHVRRKETEKKKANRTKKQVK